MPIDYLRREHRLIRRVLAAACKQSAQVGEDGHLDAEAMNALVDFFKNFLHRGHFAKEERCLGQLMREKKLASQHQTMVTEHRDLLRHRRQLAAALLATEQGEDLAVLHIRDSLQTFIELLEKHLRWEEEELYPLLGDGIGDENLPVLRGCFAQIDEELPGGALEGYIEWAEGLPTGEEE
jgi:hemerythrin-like domain-containing protein